MDTLNTQPSNSSCHSCPLHKIEGCLTTLIAWLTVVTGTAQILIPQKMLPLLSVAPDAAPAHLFATVGMFMVLFGGSVIHAQRYAQQNPSVLTVVLLWAFLQKLGASLFVAWGISKGVFAPLAGIVAGFDFLSAILFFDYRRRSAS